MMTALPLLAQKAISYDMIQRNRNLNVKLTLKDSKTSEPISWASVYLIPDGDTTITHFALSDDKGDVLIENIPTGKYELNAEMIGYIPYKKVYTFKGWEYDAGIIKLEENPEYLDAATVSAVGNAITVKKDTIEFNASSFKVGENAMLEDLLKKMPGMEVCMVSSTCAPPVIRSMVIPASRVSSFSGRRPTDRRSVSHSMYSSVPGMG